MKKIILFIAIAVSITARAQVSSVSLQASGLTCSMCSNAINKALKKLDFVQKVDAKIKTSTFEISFKPNSVINFDMLRKSVESAGFTVCAFVAHIHFDNVRVKDRQPVIFQDKTFLFVNTGEYILNGDKQVKILDKGFVSPKEYKMNSFIASSPEIFHVSL
ncbi:heavy-metal-associated domain-containing protein [Ferruginibacter paludis]|uniref:heavy-metal-associated domain-containing protein n=1 Tax=Ferruginibacter paludis TaxID=1310417 RepID=UPI0025B4466E|nr:heavy-metal-associated domain-containing protein [Ferruginibacter paludis]MDN3654185.1 heavy-metal-associated domain-containing protein [Ferruginibacter paludis]